MAVAKAGKGNEHWGHLDESTRGLNGAINAGLVLTVSSAPERACSLWLASHRLDRLWRFCDPVRYLIERFRPGSIVMCAWLGSPV